MHLQALFIFGLNFLLVTNATKIKLPDLKDDSKGVKKIQTLDHLTWTNQSLSDEGKKIYKDTLMEKTIQRFFDTFISKVKDPKIDGEQILKDPMPINEKIDVKKAGTGYEVRLKAHNILAHGFGDLKINYLRVARRFGLKDLLVNVTIATDLRLDGRYILDGKALSFLPVTGDGVFVINIHNLKLYGHTYLAFDDKANKLSMKDLDIQVRYDDIDFDFKNLMGGGIIGNTINVIINVIGEEIIKTQKGEMSGMMKDVFHDIMSQYL